MDNNKAASGGGGGVLSVLQIVFLVLKLAGLVSWKWVWVLSPIWIGIIYFVVLVIILLIVNRINF